MCYTFVIGELGDKKMFLDSVFTNKENEKIFNIKEINSWNVKSTLFSRGKMTDCFFTDDSGLYMTPKNQKLFDRGIKSSSGIGKFDSLSSRVIDNYLKFRPSSSDILYKKLVRRYAKIREDFSDIPKNIANRLTIVRLWNLSVVGAIILGMISMTFIYRYLGVGVSAEEGSGKVVINAPVEQVLGVDDIKNDEETIKYIGEVIQELENSKKEEFENEIRKMVKGYPIEKMIPYIAEKDRIVAAFLVGIAKKESNWGKRVPVLNGEDCFNYWGYRGIRKRMGTGGHTCFDSREDAVDTVAKRIEFLVKEKNLNTPAKMSIWKCGSACSKDGQVGKWISDVDLYFKKVKD